jgi:hypothetical protein
VILFAEIFLDRDRHAEGGAQDGGALGGAAQRAA